MVLKTTTCRFSGLRIWPGRGLLFIRVDGQQYLFLNRKCKTMFHQRKRPAKLAWTTTYRKAHKKDQVSEVTRKKRRALTKAAVRPIAGTSVELINKRRAEKPEARKSARETAIKEVKERAKKAKAEKSAQKSQAQSQKNAPAQKAVGRGKR